MLEKMLVYCRSALAVLEYCRSALAVLVYCRSGLAVLEYCMSCVGLGGRAASRWALPGARVELIF